MMDEQPQDLLVEMLDEIEQRGLLSPGKIQAARAWLPDISVQTPKGAKALGALATLAAHLLDYDRAGDRKRVRMIQQALGAFLKTFKRAAGPHGLN